MIEKTEYYNNMDYYQCYDHYSIFIYIAYIAIEFDIIISCCRRHHHHFIRHRQ